MTFALETQNIQKIYTSGNLSVTAVDNVTIGVHPGEFVALVGPSGSGKTSLLAILAGLLTPTSGSVLIEGHDMVRLSNKERTRFRKEKIGFTFQSNNLIPYLTAFENVELMLKLNGKNGKQSRKRAQELLERLGLEERLNNLPGQLSGGQQQRVAIARALVHDPVVVLADEPTASLDTERAYQVVETFANLIHEQNRAGIMVTHDLRMVKFVDTVIQMLDGNVAYILRDRAEIDTLAGNNQYAPPRAARHEPVLLSQTAFPRMSVPAAVGAGD